MEEPGERRLLCSLIRSQCAEGHYAAVVHDDFRRRLRRGSEQSLGTSRFIKYCRAFRLQARDAAFDELEKFSLTRMQRSEEHTSELQSPDHLVCRLLLEKKNKKINSKYS